MSRLVVSGTRDELNAWQKGAVVSTIKGVLESFVARPVILSVGDRPTGVDALVTEEGKAGTFEAVLDPPYVADWQAHRRAAGPRRNEYMLLNGRGLGLATVLVAFPVKGSKGTKSAINIALKAGIDVVVAHLDRFKGSI